MTDAYILVGAADPGGRALGFLLPVFKLHPSNSLFVQRISSDGKIAGFETVDLHRLEILNVVDGLTRVGESARWAFALSPTDVIVGNNMRGRKALEKRLDEAPLRDMPALAFEVAEFLGLSVRRAELASRTFKRLARTSEAAANRWRDLSVLTPDLRAALIERVDAKVANSVVATAEKGVLTIRRRGRLGTRTEGTVREVAGNVLLELKLLYGTGWKIRFVQIHELADRPDPPDALVYFPERRLDDLLREIVGSRSLRLVCFPEQNVAEFAIALQRQGRPGFIIADAKDDERLQTAAAGLGMNLVAISMTPPASVARPMFEEPSSLPTILVSTPSGRPGTPGRTPSRAGSVVQAIAATLAITDTRNGIRSLPPRSVLLRARGIGPDPDTDAWLAVQDRAWALGLDVNEAIRVGPKIRRIEDGGLGPDWAAHAFYGQSELIAGIADRALSTMRTDAVAIVPVTQPDEHADTRRFLAIQDILERQGWAVSRSRSERLHPRRVSGERWDFELNPRRRPPSPKSRVEPILDQPLREIATLSPNPAAGPGTILAQLFGYGELAVSVRDLVRLPAQSATVFTLLGAQLRRLASATPSRARSEFVALLVNEALACDGVYDMPIDDLRNIVRNPNLGTQLQLALRKTVTTPEGVQTDVHPALKDDRSQPMDGKRLARPFRLVVHDGGVAISRVEGPYSRS